MTSKNYILYYVRERRNFCKEMLICYFRKINKYLKSWHGKNAHCTSMYVTKWKGIQPVRGGGLLSLKSGKFVSGEKYTAPPSPTPVYTPEFSKHINRLYELAYDYRLMRLMNIESLD